MPERWPCAFRNLTSGFRPCVKSQQLTGTYPQDRYNTSDGGHKPRPSSDARDHLDWGSFPTIYPEHTWNWERYEKEEDRIYEEVQEKWKEHVCNEPAFECPISEFNQPLRRYSLPKHTCPACTLPDGAFEEGVHILARMVGRSGEQDILNEYTRLRQKYYGLCRHKLHDILKKRTGVLKMGGECIHRNWRHLCYWEVMYGYRTYTGVEALYDDAYKWLGTKLDLGGPLGEDVYCDLVYKGTIELLTTDWDLPRDILTLDDWISKGLWMRGKAGTGMKTTIEVDGKAKKTRATKGVDSVLMSDAEIKDTMLAATQEEFHVMEKSEAGKVRPVVKTGNDVCRKMDFISQALENGFKGSISSTLFAGTAGNEEIDKELLELTRNTSIWKVPLDQSNFDQHQSFATIYACMSAIGVVLEKSLGRDHDIIKVWKALWDSIFLTPVIVKCGSKSFIWTNGLPSGWRWTAVLDTILNLVSFKIIVGIAEQVRKTTHNSTGY